ncbi:V-type proton ATPase subunit D [Fonticula alba]|uniref:V-type proton ATPase subunit D n=1 Tax=Fonticula alba TaxID=691883 RepID=A0A058Z9A5_FONAL|nr:V-type proton ATPase subunit D [Fonticula alba]KCV70097.1 V-type proton ATPase subunit D [Fonticula alba]|eukprot:XP_009495703.1 V-type proton ATPase subunit D [Fonticula alba]
MNLAQCETLDDLKLHLSGSDYGNFLQNEPSPLATTTISQKCTEKMVAEFRHLRANAVPPLSKFLDYITYGYMIDNIVLILTGTLHERDTSELLEKCHPLGMFEALPSLCVATTTADLYNSVIIDTPLAPYFSASLSEADLDELNIEIIRNTLYKAYLEDFHAYCQRLGGTTAEIMGKLLAFEADRRAINITINSFGTDLTKDERSRLFPTIGQLHPDGLARLARADDVEGVAAACSPYPEYSRAFEDAEVEGKSLEECFYAYEVELLKSSFEQHFHFATFYAFVRLKEQEIRNIVWIAECIAQSQRDKINHYINIFN